MACGQLLFRSLVLVVLLYMYNGFIMEHPFYKKERKNKNDFVFNFEQFQTPVILQQVSVMPLALTVLKNTC